jgi:hypothetical protein
MKISIIHASYGRPELAAKTATKWLSEMSLDNEHGYILSIDTADLLVSSYIPIYRTPITISTLRNDKAFNHIINNTHTSVAAINNAASQSTGDIIIVISDDFEPIKNWDIEILKVVEGKKDWILKTQDGTQPWIITLPIMDRAYYERFGYIYHPEYEHLFADTELTAVADYTGRKITSDLLFRHRHYSEKDGIKKDATSQKADRTWNQGEQLFLKHYEQNFGIENPIRSREVDQTINWIKNRK